MPEGASQRGALGVYSWEVKLTDDAELAKLLLNDGVVGDGDPGAVDLGVSALVDELSDGLEVDLAVGDVRSDECEHLLGRLGDSDKDTVVDLSQSEELKDLAGLGGDLGDTIGSQFDVALRARGI